MNDNKLIKFLIPLIAAVVVFESIVLVNNLEKSNNKVTTENTSQELVEEVKEIEEPVINFSFNSTNSAEMKIGKTYKMNLILTSDEDKVVDGMETYVKYDPETFKVTGLVANKNLVKPDVSKIDDQLGMISNVMLIDDKNGLSLEAGKELNILTFNIVPLVEGKFNVELGNGGSNKIYDTLVVETGTAKSLGWTGGKLEINVIK